MRCLNEMPHERQESANVHIKSIHLVTLHFGSFACFSGEFLLKPGYFDFTAAFPTYMTKMTTKSCKSDYVHLYYVGLTRQTLLR